MRTWPGLAAIGAGLVHLGTAAGGPLPLLVPLVLMGAAELLWGVLALARPRPPAARPALLGVGGVLVLTVVGVLLPPAAERYGEALPFSVPAVALLGGGALDAALGLLLLIHLERGGPAARESGPVAFLLAAGGAAALVAVTTTASLASTGLGGPMRMH